MARNQKIRIAFLDLQEAYMTVPTVKFWEVQTTDGEYSTIDDVERKRGRSVADISKEWTEIVFPHK
jgi:hypothetical protein